MVRFIQFTFWWPCKITKKEEGKYLVSFYGTDENEKFAWIKHEKYLKKFSSKPPQTEGKNYSSYQYALKIAIEMAKNELDPDKNVEEICYICSKPGLLILCDGCTNGVHQDCEGIDEIPEGDFFCSVCCKKEEYVFFHNDCNVQIYTRTDPLQKIFERSYWDELDIKDRKELFEVSSKYKYSSRKLFIRYKYFSEKNDDFRVIKLETTDNEINGASLKKLLDYDNAKNGEIRYYDEEDDGWILLRENKIFRFSEKIFNIKLIIIA